MAFSTCLNRALFLLLWLHQRAIHATLTKVLIYMANAEYAWMYRTRLWKQGRASFLRTNPLCEICRNAGRVTPSTVVNHRIAHRGHWSTFKDVKNWQALCKSCHDSEGQSTDVRGYSNRKGDDGWPTDKRHPFNRVGG